MGAMQFEVVAKGRTAREAFAAAVQSARWEYGHGGYTGTIAEKAEFSEVVVPADVTPEQFVGWVLHRCDLVRIEVPGPVTREDWRAGRVDTMLGDTYYRTERRPIPPENLSGKRVQKSSLVSSLSRYIRAGEVFTRPREGYYGLVEFAADVAEAVAT